jgi:hypothetical protein
MTAKEYTKMLNPIVYNPFLERDIIFPAIVHPPLDEQRSNNIMLQGVGAEPGELVLQKNIPLYLLQAKVHLFSCPDLWAFEHIHFSRHLSHPVSIPLNYVGEDTYVQELGEAFLKNSSTFIDGFTYYDEPLVSTFEGLGFAFPVQSYHDTMQVPTHNQGFEILCRNLFSYNKAFCQLVKNQNPNEALHPQLVRDFIWDPTTIDRILGNSDVERYLDPESNGWDYILHPHVTRPLEGFEEILTQQFWNHIIDARWRRIWKRKNPWFEAWRELTFTYELDAERSPRIAFAALPSGLISTNDDSILSSQLERKNQPTMKSYLLNFAVIVFNHPLTPLWPLPMWLGGRYMNIVKPGYAACIPTKAKYWTFSHLHLAVCTSRYFFCTICILQ